MNFALMINYLKCDFFCKFFDEFFWLSNLMWFFLNLNFTNLSVMKIRTFNLIPAFSFQIGSLLKTNFFRMFNDKFNLFFTILLFILILIGKFGGQKLSFLKKPRIFIEFQLKSHLNFDLQLNFSKFLFDLSHMWNESKF